VAVNINPILIIGTQRSGSNLLRLMLNQFNEIEAPHPPHILQTFYPLLPLYGNLSNTENFMQLATDVVEFIEVNPVPWHGFDFSTGELLEECRVNTLVEVFKQAYALKAARAKASFWCCKSMANVYYLDKIEAEMQPVYIHLVRDLRDVAASFKNAVVGEKHVYHIAKLWKQEQQLALENTKLRAAERSFVIKYEQMIANPKETLTPLLNHINIDWNDKVLEFYQSSEAVNTASSGDMWRNVAKPVVKDNTRKYMKHLTEDDIFIIEAVAGDVMKELCYELHNNINPGHTFSAEEIEGFTSENIRLKKEAQLKFDKDAHMRDKQNALIAAIKHRGSNKSS
jgi:hypothetical protein